MRIKAVATLILALVVCQSALSHAQITLDGSMGTAGPLTGPNFVIPSNVGQTRGSNLFHSFGLFNVQTSQSATFTGPDSISNIFSRITGGQPSTINGQIRSTIANANLYLMNPAGMMFGPNASLDVQGSFHVTTSDYLKFADGAKFHADLSRQSTLTTAPLSAFGFVGESPAGISVQGGPVTFFFGIPIGVTGSLLVNSAKDVSLVGGDLNIAGNVQATQVGFPTIGAFGGRINLASVASPGEVAADVQATDLTKFARLGQINLSNAAVLDVTNIFSGSQVGRVVIRGGRLMMDAASVFAANLQNSNASGLAVDVNVTGNASMANQSLIATDSFAGGPAKDIRIAAGTLDLDNAQIRSAAQATGAGGNVQVDSGDLTLTNGASIATQVVSSGHAGIVHVTATGTITLDGDNSRIAATTQSGSQGNVGSVLVQAQNLDIKNQAAIRSDTIGAGNSGEVRVLVGEALNLDNGKVFAQSLPGSTGNGGDIVVEAKNLSAVRGGQIGSSSFGAGNGGNVNVTVSETIDLDGINFNAQSTPFPTGIFSNANSTGSAGSVIIQARDLNATGGAQVGAGTFGSGNGGTLQIEASGAIRLAWQSVIGSPSGVFTSAETGATGNAGNAFINTGSLSVTDGAEIRGSTFGPGKGGSLQITAAQAIDIEGTGRIVSQTFSSGEAGAVFIRTRILSADNGAQIATGTFGAGKGGVLSVTADESLHLDGIRVDQQGTPIPTAISSGAVTGTGAAGNTFISAKNLTLTGGAQIGAGTFSSGDGGSLRIDATETISLAGSSTSNGIVVNSGLFVSAQQGSTGRAGDMIINTNILSVRGGAGISSGTEGLGVGGNIDINAQQVSLNNDGLISARSSGSGDAGNINVFASDSVRLADSRITTAATFADGGNIHVKAKRLVDLLNSEISTSVGTGAGAGGNILIDPQFVILNHSQITANAFGGPGGNITIIADNFLSSTDSAVTASSALSTPGIIDIQAPITDLSGSLAPLPESIVQATSLLRQSCATRYGSGKLSSLASPGRGGMPFEPGGFMPSPLVGLADSSPISIAKDRAEPAPALLASARPLYSIVSPCGR